MLRRCVLGVRGSSAKTDEMWAAPSTLLHDPPAHAKPSQSTRPGSTCVNAGTRMPRMKLDFPEPETPVTDTSLPKGILHVMLDSVWI